MRERTTVFQNSRCIIFDDGFLVLREKVSSGEIIARLEKPSGKSLIIRAGDNGRKGDILFGAAARIRKFLRPSRRNPYS